MNPLTKNLDKKGSVYSLMVYIFEHSLFRVIFTLIVVMTAVFLLRSLLVVSIDSDMVEKNALVYNIFYSPAGFSYTDPGIGRTYPGIIDLSKFTSQQLDSAVSFTNNQHIAASFTLFDPGSNTPLNHPSAIFNERYFSLKYPLADRNVKGSAGATLYHEQVMVKVLTDADHPENAKVALLKIETIIGN